MNRTSLIVPIHPSSFILHPLRNMATISQALSLALRYHQSGNLPKAEAIYRQILQVDPGHADALHLLGVMAGQAGKKDQAIRYIRQAIRARPGEPAFHYNLGKALQDQGYWPEAIMEYRQALR